MIISIIIIHVFSDNSVDYNIIFYYFYNTQYLFVFFGKYDSAENTECIGNAGRLL